MSAGLQSYAIVQWPTGYSNIVINVAHIGIPEDSGSRSQTTYRNKYLIDSCIFVDRHILTRSFNKKYSYLYPSMLSYSLLLINTVETLREKPVIFTNLYPIQTCYIHQPILFYKPVMPTNQYQALRGISVSKLPVTVFERKT